jgi:hypothetical protein
MDDHCCVTDALRFKSCVLNRDPARTKRWMDDAALKVMETPHIRVGSPAQTGFPILRQHSPLDRSATYEFNRVGFNSRSKPVSQAEFKRDAEGTTNAHNHGKLLVSS